MRYVMRIAESSESSKFWTQLALPRKYVCWSVCSSQPEVKTLWSRPFGVSTLNALRCNPSDTYRTSTIITSLRGMRMKSTWRNFYPRWSASLHLVWYRMTAIRSDLQSVKITRWI